MDGHGNEVKAAPDEWRLPTDEDELRELTAAGVVLEANEDHTVVLLDRSTAPQEDIARVAGMTAFYLGRIASLDADEALLRETKRFELARVERAYGPQILAIEEKRDHFEKRVHQLTDLANGLGAFEKKKSIKTSRGTFGIKAVPAKAKINEVDTTVEWASAAMPDVVRVTVQMSLDRLDDILAALFGRSEGVPTELPWKEIKREVLISALENAGVDLINSDIPGVLVTPATTEYVVKPSADA